jgi:undecaprenyl pyrophosphate synthase
MYRITIKGEAKTDYENLSDLNGIDCQDEFSEYFSSAYKGDEQEQSLIDKGVCSGYMHFESDGTKLYVIVNYTSPTELTQEELNILVDYTQGQLSDGIGEGFEQMPCHYDDNDEDVFISPWFPGQVLTATQEKK